MKQACKRGYPYSRSQFSLNFASTIEKEAFAIHYSLQKLDYYLHNSMFVIKTDHKLLKYLLESPIQNKKIQLWVLGMSGYNCKTEYIAGTENTCADLLSRKPNGECTDPILEPFELDINDNIFEVSRNDKFL